ncbi:MAG: HAD family hydrolase [Bacilli bacterium]|nr:HAD family hydrolase [Bacilli bacterium]
MKYGCIFDLDGTLVNSLMDLGLSVNKVLENHYLPTYSIEEYNFMVGNGVRKLMERALKQHSDMLEECLKEFYEIYEENCLENTLPYEGIKELIERLKAKDMKLAVVTNKPHHLAVKIVETLFPDTFDAIYGQQDFYPVKPSPESTMYALMAMRLSKEDCLFVGDSNVDIETAINTDMESAGVCWGFRGEQELIEAGADYICYNPDDIERVLFHENRS